MKHKLSIYIFIISIIFPNLATAKVYRCTDVDGTVIFSETPCKGSDKGVIDIENNRKQVTNPDKVCREVQYMSEALFPELQGKQYATEVITKFGGVHALSSTTSNLINFVSFYRFHEDLDEIKMGKIAFDRCKSGSLGKLTMSDIPDWRALGYSSITETKNKNPHGKKKQLCNEYSQVLALINEMINTSKDEREINNLKSDRAYIEHIEREYCKK